MRLSCKKKVDSPADNATDSISYDEVRSLPAVLGRTLSHTHTLSQRGRRRRYCLPTVEMAALSSSVPVVSDTGPGRTYEENSFFSYVRESVSGTATLLENAPLAVATEVAHVMQEVPVVGIVCRTYLLLEQLVDTARSNKEELATLRDLCEAVIKGVLDKRSNSGLLQEGFTKLREHVQKAKEVAQLCNKQKRGVAKYVLARKTCNEIATVRSNVLAFCTTSNLVLTDDIHV